MMYLIRGVDSRERALETVHLFAAHVGLAVASTEQVVIAVLDRCDLVVF